MPYGDTVLLPLFIVCFQYFELKHFYLFIFIIFKIVEVVALHVFMLFLILKK